MDTQTAEDLQEGLALLIARRGRYRLFEDYYEGRHRLAFATAKFREAFGLLFREFADNLCKPVIGALEDRLEVAGFGTESGGTEDDALAKEAAAIWSRSRMAVRSGALIRGALKLGDAYLIVWPGEDGKARLYPNEADKVAVVYDEETGEVPRFGVKVWKDGHGGAARVRVNLFYPDRVLKFVARKAAAKATEIPPKAGAYEVFEGDDDGGEVENPYGRVPIFHLPNNADDDGDGGRSELEDAIPIQDALNKSVCDLLVAMEFASFPQRYILGMEVELDEASGKPKDANLRSGPGRVWALGDASEAGQFGAADVEKLRDVCNDFRVEIARVTGTPLHYMALTGTANISGDALKALDVRLVKRAKKRQEAYGVALADAVAFAMQIDKRPGADGLQLKTLWEPAEIQSQQERADVAKSEVELGLPLAVALERYGLPKKDAEQYAAEYEKKQGGLAALASSMFNRGGGGQ